MNFPRTPTLKVKAKHAGKPCPMARQFRRLDKGGRDTSMIYADKPVEVPNNRYYRRRVVAGDLVLVDESAIRMAELQRASEKGQKRAEAVHAALIPNPAKSSESPDSKSEKKD